MNYILTKENAIEVMNILDSLKTDGSVTISIEKTKRTRTSNQNRAFWRYLTLVAEKMVEGGCDMRKIVKIPIQPSKDNLMADIVHPVIEQRYRVNSSAKLSTVQLTELYDTLNLAFGERFGIHIPFPSWEQDFMENGR